MEKATVKPLLVSVSDAAVMLSLSKTSVYELMNQGELPYCKVGAIRRIAVEDVERFIERTRVSG